MLLQSTYSIISSQDNYKLNFLGLNILEEVSQSMLSTFQSRLLTVIINLRNEILQLRDCSLPAASLASPASGQLGPGGESSAVSAGGQERRRQRLSSSHPPPDRPGPNLTPFPQSVKWPNLSRNAKKFFPDF